MIWIIFLVLGLLAGFIAGAFFWSLYTYQWEKEIQDKLHAERQRKNDINLRVWVEQEEGRQWARFLAGSDVDPHRAVDCLARAHYSSVSFSEEGTSGIMSRREFRRLRDWLLEGEFIRWENPDHHNQGVTFTNTGQALIRAAADYVANPTPPPPSDVQHRTTGGRGVRMRTYAR